MFGMGSMFFVCLLFTVPKDAMGKKKEKKPDIQCALVEYLLRLELFGVWARYVRGIRARKWSFQLGQTYVVGRAGGCVDIEIDHSSLSRKHCSLAP